MEEVEYGTCEDGYQGVLCAQCQDGWVREALQKCRKCGDWNTTVLQGFIRFASMFLLVFGISNLSFKNMLGDRGNDVFVVLIKTGLNHTVTFYILSHVRYTYPDMIKVPIEINELVVRTISRAINYDCLFLGQGQNHDSTLSVHWLNLIASCLKPLLIVGICSFFNLISGLISQGNIPTMYRDVKNRGIGTFIIAFWIFYQDICLNTF